MKVKMKATVVFTWEEDSKNWVEADPMPETKEELLELVQRTVEEDHSYVLDIEPDSIDVELEE